MNKTYLFIILAIMASVSFTSCKDDDTSIEPAPESTPGTVDPTAWNFDALIDSMIRPGDNFYDYICKGYTKEYTKGVMYEQKDLGEEFLKRDFSASPSPEIQRLYEWKGVDADEITKRNQQYCKSYCKQIDAMTTHDLLVTLLRNCIQKKGSCLKVESYALARKQLVIPYIDKNINFKKWTKYLASASGLTAEVVDSLIDLSNAFANILVENTSSETRAYTAIRDLANHRFTPVEGDYFGTMEKTTRTPGAENDEVNNIILDGLFLNAGDEQYVGDSSGTLAELRKLFQAVLDEPEDKMQSSLSAYLQLCHMIDTYDITNAASSSDFAQYLLNNTFFGKTLLANLYLREKITAEDVDNCRQLAEQFRSTFSSRLENLDWMSPSTKKYAQKKLDKMVFWYGIPSSDLSKFDFNIDPQTMNLSACEFLSTNSEAFYKQIVLPIVKGDKIEDFYYISTVIDCPPYMANAFYDEENNVMAILASNLIAPISRKDVSLPYNYATIGATTIGHEMCHGFDATGSRYDEVGNIANWWAVSDALKYKEKKDQMILIFNQYSMTNAKGENFQVDGANTLQENMADLGGIAIGLDALIRLRRSQGYDEAGIREQARRYFLAWGMAWSETDLYSTEKGDVHSPAFFRVNGCVNQIDEWYDIFDVKWGDKYYLEKNQRVSLW